MILAATALVAALPTGAAEWRPEIIPTVGPVKAIATVGGEAQVAIGQGWFRVIVGTHTISLAATAGPPQRPLRPDALPDGKVADGRRDIAHAWLAEPTGRYDHGVLGDAIEAASVVIERRNGEREAVRLGPDAVFEDLEPRIVDLGDGGGDKVLVVKSYLHLGSALAVIGERDGHFAVVAETAPLGGPHRWLNPVGVGDFDGDGAVDVALVRQPHAVGNLELWSWRDGRLRKAHEVADVTNHVIGTRVLRMSAVADFDGDGHPDVAIPSFDRRALRVLSFAAKDRDLARVPLPARVATEIAVFQDHGNAPGVVVGLENGALVAIRKWPRP